MPREIIDTKTSRPAYIRRRWITAVVASLVALILAGGVWMFVASHRPAGAAMPTTPGNSAH